VGKNAQRRRATKHATQFLRKLESSQHGGPRSSWLSQKYENARAEVQEDKYIPNRAERRGNTQRQVPVRVR